MTGSFGKVQSLCALRVPPETLCTEDQGTVVWKCTWAAEKFCCGSLVFLSHLGACPFTHFSYPWLFSWWLTWTHLICRVPLTTYALPSFFKAQYEHWLSSRKQITVLLWPQIRGCCKIVWSNSPLHTRGCFFSLVPHEELRQRSSLNALPRICSLVAPSCLQLILFSVWAQLVLWPRVSQRLVWSLQHVKITCN